MLAETAGAMLRDSSARPMVTRDRARDGSADGYGGVLTRGRAGVLGA